MATHAGDPEEKTYSSLSRKQIDDLNYKPGNVKRGSKGDATCKNQETEDCACKIILTLWFYDDKADKNHVRDEVVLEKSDYSFKDLLDLFDKQAKPKKDEYWELECACLKLGPVKK